MDPLERHRRLVDGLLEACGDRRAELIETHISSVILTGAHAYKLKKPVDLGFVNFLALEDRLHFCREEIRLNRRLAPSIYIDVVPVTGSLDDPRFGGDGEALEYAVRMHRFDQADLLDHRAEAHGLDPAWFDRLAGRVARFHGRIPAAPAESEFGLPHRVVEPMLENFPAVRGVIASADRKAQVATIEAWTRRTAAALEETLRERRSQGRVRECHGDMHLGNMALIHGRVEVFDGIEFNDWFRWIDVHSEIAFLTMDLDHRQESALAWRFLNAYLEQSGDFAGLSVARFYQAYRAMVRAKVAAIRAGQMPAANSERSAVLEDCGVLLDLAEGYTHDAGPRMYLTCGLSGSGKTTVARARACDEGLIHLRSDVERKRLFGLAPDADSASGLDAGIYTAEATDRTYARLRELAGAVLEAGFSVVVDATFLKRDRRLEFQTLADGLEVPYQVLVCEAPVALLEQRIVERQGDASEASVQVLHRQREGAEWPGVDEPSARVATAS